MNGHRYAGYISLVNGMHFVYAFKKLFQVYLFAELFYIA